MRTFLASLSNHDLMAKGKILSSQVSNDIESFDKLIEEIWSENSITKREMPETQWFQALRILARDNH